MIVIFDAYGTLWDIRRIQSAVEQAVDREKASAFLALWRQKQLEYAFLRTLMDRYKPFFEVTADALTHTLAVYGMSLSDTARAGLLDAWNRPVPFPDACDMLRRLAPLKRAILSNGDPAMLARGVAASGLEDCLNEVLSVDGVKRYKPHPSTYQWAVEQLHAKPEQVVFVSSNAWDIAGAHHFGFRTVWVNRGGVQREELSADPWQTVSSLSEIPELIN